MIGVGTRDGRKGGIRQQGMDIGDPTRGLAGNPRLDYLRNLTRYRG